MKKARRFLPINLLLQVLKENDVRKEELQGWATALKILGKIFQVHILTYLASSFLTFSLPWLTTAPNWYPINAILLKWLTITKIWHPNIVTMMRHCFFRLVNDIKWHAYFRKRIQKEKHLRRNLLMILMTKEAALIHQTMNPIEHH